MGLQGREDDQEHLGPVGKEAHQGGAREVSNLRATEETEARVGCLGLAVPVSRVLLTRSTAKTAS